MRTDRPIRVQLTLSEDGRKIAFMIAVLSHGNTYTIKRILTAVAAYFDFQVVAR